MPMGRSVRDAIAVFTVVGAPFRVFTFVATVVVVADTPPGLSVLADFAPLPPSLHPAATSATVHRHAPMIGRRLISGPRHRGPASRGTTSRAQARDTRR